MELLYYENTIHEGGKNLFKKNKFKIVACFLIYEIVFISITSPFYIYKGPFNTLKKIVVATIMGTRHQYLVTSFLSENEINNIINKNTLNNTQKETTNNVNIVKNESDKITRYEVKSDSGRYSGYLLSIPATYKIKVAWTKKLGIEGERTSEMAKEHNALAAINGGAFTDNKSQTYGGSAAFPGGFVISNGNIIYPTSNVNMDKKESVTAFTKSGKLIVGDYSINDLKGMDVSEAVCFIPPTLVLNGKGQISDSTSAGLNPRTAIGQTANGTVLFLVLDGRKNFINSGASLKDVQDLMLKYGAVNATSLDGGFSSTMYYNGKVINNTHSWNGERYVATSLYVEP